MFKQAQARGVTEGGDRELMIDGIDKAWHGDQVKRKYGILSLKNPLFPAGIIVILCCDIKSNSESKSSVGTSSVQSSSTNLLAA
jgi:hypothetical protein